MVFNCREEKEVEKRQMNWLYSLRCIGIFLIVYGHTIQYGVINKYFYSFHVPLFVFCSGLVFSNNTSLGQKLKKRTVKLLIPYLFFAFASILIFQVVSAIGIGNLSADRVSGTLPEQILQVFTGYCDSNGPLWFIPTLILIEIMAFLCCYIWDNLSINSTAVKFASVVALSAGWIVLNKKVFAINNSLFNFEAGINLLLFFMVGYLFKDKLYGVNNQKNISDKKRILSAVVMIVGGFLLSQMNGYVGYLGNYYGNTVLYICSALLSIGGVFLVSVYFEKIAFTNYIGKRTLAILLMHKFPILFFQLLFPHIKNKMTVLGVVATIASVMLCLMADWILNTFIYKHFYARGKRSGKKV